MDGVTRRVAAATVVVLLALAAFGGVAAASPSEESQFVGLINASRQAAGLAPLSSHADLVDDARAHTAQMIAKGTIFHSTTSQLSSYATGWSLLGENVGMGPNPDLLHAAFMKSPSHKANILGAFQYVGVGAEHAADGTLFVTVLFMQVPAPTTTTTAPPPATTAPPATAPPTTAFPTTTQAPTAAPATVPVTTTTTTTLPPAASGHTAPRTQVASAGTDEAAPAPEAPLPSVSRVEAMGLAHTTTGEPWGMCVRLKADGAICIE